MRAALGNPQLLIAALDEFHAGRMVEVEDILASHLRYLSAGIEKSAWKVARTFLVYHTQYLSLTSDEMFEEALKIREHEIKLEKRLVAAKDGPARK